MSKVRFMEPANPQILAARYRWIHFALFSILWSTPLFVFWLDAWALARRPPIAPFAAAMPLAFGALALPGGYFRPKAFEAGGRIYVRLGVRVFKWLTTDGDAVNRRIRRRHPGYRVIGHPTSMAEHERGGRDNERWHLALFLFTLPSVAYAVRLGWFAWAAYLTAASVLVHLYPVMLQRHKRARILLLLCRRRCRPEPF